MTRIATPKNVFTRINVMVTNRAISFIKEYVWFTLTLGWEVRGWKQDEATEMWYCRRMLELSLMENFSNEKVLNRAEAKRDMMRVIRRRQLRCLGYAMRRQQTKAIAWLEGSMAEGEEENLKSNFWISLQKLLEEELDRWKRCRWRAGEKTSDLWWPTSLGIQNRGKVRNLKKRII